MHYTVCSRRRSLSRDCRASWARPFLQDLLQRRRQVLRGVSDASVRRLSDLSFQPHAAEAYEVQQTIDVGLSELTYFPGDNLPGKNQLNFSYIYT